MFKKLSLVFVLVLGFAITSNAQMWEFDKVHSNVGFSVKHLVISNVKGKFDNYSGHIMFDGKNFDNASIDVTIQMASINTDNEKRDGHLGSPDFFDVEKHPTMTFKSTKVTNPKEGHFQIMGDLTIKDVTLPVTLESEYSGTITGPYGNTRAGFSATTTIDRQDYNVAWENKLQDGSLVVGNDVTINLDIELIKSEKMLSKDE
ncbi:MAG: YceI family protein [candidate division Zixibacteria bacterium]|nr:YceI family protein [candidate division Zixibacteria bacterium]